MLKKLISVVIAAAAVAPLRGEIIEQILVKVNGEIFTKTELEQRQVSILRQRGQQMDLKTDAGNQQLKKALDEITPQLMVDVLDEMLIVQRGRELGYRLSDEQFKSVVDNIKKENKIESEEQFQAALKSENMTMVELRRNLERSMIVQRVQQNEVMGKIGVTEAEARTYYDTHREEFTTLPSVTLREIVVSVPSDNRGINVAAEETAQQKIDQLRTRVTTGGESFDKVAAEASDAPSKANGGLIGPISVNDLSPELRKIIEGIKVGDVTAAFRTAREFRVFKLESSTPVQTMAFDQAREQIADRVFTDKRKGEYAKYLDKLRAQAIIEWKNEDIKRAFDEGLKQQRATLLAPAGGL
jgi:peptidyl-prolyl cis-trans isomerase SurA